MKFAYLFLLFSFFCGKNSWAAAPIPSDSLRVDSLTVKQINVTGNKRTKLAIALREVPFVVGSKIASHQLSEKLEQARRQMMNSALYVSVLVEEASREADQLTINIVVHERWYFFPVPYFKLIDRNFNQWWVDQKRSLDRVNYGMKFSQQNTTGRNDNLDIWLITGYTNQISIKYASPFVDKKLMHGFSIGYISNTQKELNYATENNKQQFFKLDEVVKKSVRLDLTYSYRPDSKQRHFFTVGYSKERVADSVFSLNPQYMPTYKKAFQFLDFLYEYKYYNVDYNPYPLKGHLIDFTLYRRGFNNQEGFWQMGARAIRVSPIANKTYLHVEAMGVAKVPFRNYFSNQRLFGYGYFQMRGNEYYVIDGMIGAALKTTIQKEVFSFVMKNPYKVKNYEKIPFRVFLKAYGDLGYAYHPDKKVSNSLTNVLLKTWGLGIDIVTIYDVVFKFEYSFDQLGKSGVYLHGASGF